jgi:hypothetical protein
MDAPFNQTGSADVLANVREKNKALLDTFGVSIDKAPEISENPRVLHVGVTSVFFPR